MLNTRHNFHVSLYYTLWVQRKTLLTASQFLTNVIFGFYWLLVHWFVSVGCSSALKTLSWTWGRNLWHIFMEAEGLIFSLYRMFQLVRAAGAVAPGMVSYFIAGLLLNYFSVRTRRPGEPMRCSEEGREMEEKQGAAPAAEAWCELSCCWVEFTADVPWAKVQKHRDDIRTHNTLLCSNHLWCHQQRRSVRLIINKMTKFISWMVTEASPRSSGLKA